MYEDAAAERYRNEALRADFLSPNVETTGSVGDVEDYEAEEREEIKIFGELEKSEVRFTLQRRMILAAPGRHRLRWIFPS